MTASILILFILGLANCEVLHTKLGNIEASELISRDGRPYLVYSKIPYAKPPIGQLRFAAPEPHGPWKETIPAGQQMPSCSQKFFFAPPGVGFEGSEDCLYLTIHKPKTDAEDLPVIVYVHGGAFILGDAGPPSMATYLMDEDVIFISIHYRLGALGFMSLNDTKFSGNYGLKDQIAAVNWVHENIRDYGGDPNKIVAIGESAGGASVHLLLLMPGSRDKLVGAFALSGTNSITCTMVPPKRVKMATEEVARKFGCKGDSAEEILACFRAVEDHREFVTASIELAPCIVSTLVFTPTIEPPGPEAVVTENMEPSTKPIVASFAAGEHLLPKILLGIPGPGEARVAKMSQDLFGYTRKLLEYRVNDKILDSSTKKLMQRYFRQETNSVDELLHDSSVLFQDICFVYPAMELAASHHGPVWLYQLVHRGEVSLTDLRGKTDTKIACHADDKVFYFNSRDRFPFAKPEEDIADIKVSKQLIGYLMNFAKFGHPTPEGKPLQWEPYKKSGQLLQVHTHGSEIGDDKFTQEHRDILKFWRELMKVPPIKDEL